MRSVFSFIKYNERLMEDIEKLTKEEKEVIYRRTDPFTIRKFTDEKMQILMDLEKKYGKFTKSYSEVEIEGPDEVEEIIFQAMQQAGYIEYYTNNPFKEK